MKRFVIFPLLAFALSACWEEEVTPVAETAVRPVRTIEVTQTGGLHDRFFVGIARAAREATVSFAVPGTVQVIDASVGDTIEEGELIASLDTSPFEAEVARLSADLESAEATLANAQAQTDRQRTLVERDVAAQARLDTFEAQEGSALAGVKSLEAALERARIDLNNAQLKAPFTGIVVATFVEDFEEVAAKEPVMRILDANKIEMVIDVPERFVSILPKIGDIRVTFNALGPNELSAEITEVGAEASVTTGTFPITLQMDQPEAGQILPGMTGRARGTPTAADARIDEIFVPVEAVFTPEGSEEPHVWVLDDTAMTVSERPVVLGPAGTLGVAVSEGLSVGEIVVAAGASSLRPGQTVSFLDDGDL